MKAAAIIIAVAGRDTIDFKIPIDGWSQEI